MRKSLELFVKQNPIFEAECPNPACKKTIKIKSKELFSVPIYKMICPHCEKEISFDTTELADDFERQLKEIGITWE